MKHLLVQTTYKNAFISKNTDKTGKNIHTRKHFRKMNKKFTKIQTKRKQEVKCNLHFTKLAA